MGMIKPLTDLINNAFSSRNPDEYCNDQNTMLIKSDDYFNNEMQELK